MSQPHSAIIEIVFTSEDEDRLHSYQKNFHESMATVCPIDILKDGIADGPPPDFDANRKALVQHYYYTLILKLHSRTPNNLLSMCLIYQQWASVFEAHFRLLRFDIAQL